MGTDIKIETKIAKDGTQAFDEIGKISRQEAEGPLQDAQRSSRSVKLERLVEFVEQVL